jgi:SAM-dependent methyltransferase
VGFLDARRRLPLIDRPVPSHTAAVMTNDFHRANRERWEAGSARWAEMADSREIWRRCPSEPGLVLCDRELELLREVKGQRVCVLGSGDNQVAFALAGLGARVTSVDFSRNQLDVASRRAAELGLAIDFVQADVTDLSAFGNGRFEAVYTGGHVAVWVSDLARYYGEAGRVLAPGGLFIVNEYHPFRRVWRRLPDRLVLGTTYFDRGPHGQRLTADILEPVPGPYPTYEFHWTVGDYIGAVIAAGCRIVLVEEHGEECGDWEGAPMAGLPEFLLIAARKTTTEDEA